MVEEKEEEAGGGDSEAATLSVEATQEVTAEARDASSSPTEPSTGPKFPPLHTKPSTVTISELVSISKEARGRRKLRKHDTNKNRLNWRKLELQRLVMINRFENEKEHIMTAMLHQRRHYLAEVMVIVLLFMMISNTLLKGWMVNISGIEETEMLFYGSTLVLQIAVFVIVFVFGFCQHFGLKFLRLGCIGCMLAVSTYFVITNMIIEGEQRFSKNALACNATSTAPEQHCYLGVAMIHHGLIVNFESLIILVFALIFSMHSMGMNQSNIVETHHNEKTFARAHLDSQFVRRLYRGFLRHVDFDLETLAAGTVEDTTPVEQQAEASESKNTTRFDSVTTVRSVKSVKAAGKKKKKNKEKEKENESEDNEANQDENNNNNTDDDEAEATKSTRQRQQQSSRRVVASKMKKGSRKDLKVMDTQATEDSIKSIRKSIRKAAPAPPPSAPTKVNEEKMKAGKSKSDSDGPPSVRAKMQQQRAKQQQQSERKNKKTKDRLDTSRKSVKGPAAVGNEKGESKRASGRRSTSATAAKNVAAVVKKKKSKETTNHQ